VIPVASGGPAPRRARILVVDDEPAILRAIQGVLGAADHDVLVAEGGPEALTVLRGDVAFDALLCDLHMPQVDGIAVHSWLRGHEPELARRTIFLTADSVSDRARQFISAVEPVVVSKPISAADLDRALRPFLPK
jgi:CheY-like chemotaxis protein